MRIRVSFILSVIILPLLLICCGREAAQRMSVADSLMEERPDSALVILASIDTAMRHGNAQEARYDMLLTDALYRCDADSLLNDSVIDVAVKHYERRDDAPNAARAHYLAGIVDSKTGKRVRSITHLLHAEKYALRNTEDHFQLALIYRELGDIFWDADDIASSAKYHLQSYHKFKKANKRVHAAHALYNTAATFLLLNDQKRFWRYLDMAVPMAREINDSELLGFLMSLKGVYYYQTGSYDKCIKLFCDMRDKGGYFTQRELYYLGLSYFASGDIDSTEKCLALMSDTPPSHENNKNYDLQEYIYKYNDNYKEAYRSLEKEIDQLNGITTSIWNRDVRGVIDGYYKAEEQQTQEELSNSRLIIIIIVLSVVFLTVGVLILFRLRYIANKRKQAEYMLRIASLKEELGQTGILVSDLKNALDKKTRALSIADDTVARITAEMEGTRIQAQEEKNNAEANKSKIADMQRHIRTALTGRYKTLDDMYYSYCLSPGAKKQSEIYKEISDQVEKLMKDRKTIAEVEKLIDECLDGLVTDMKGDFPNLSKDDYFIFIYSLSGLSNASMSVIFDLKPNAFYQKKSRLKKRLGDRASRSGIRYADLL